MQTFKMLIEIGQPFPEQGKDYEFYVEKTGAEFVAEVHWVKIIGWETKGKIGVYVEVTTFINEFTKPGCKRAKLWAVE